MIDKTADFFFKHNKPVNARGTIAPLMECVRHLRLLLVLCLATQLWSADENWQAARIVDVQKNVDSQTMYWVANTPVTRDVTTYRISVHHKDKILIGAYTASRSQPPPPEEWSRDRLVKLRLEGDNMYLLARSGDEFKLPIAKRKNAPMLPEVSAAELEGAYVTTANQPQPESPIGFSKPAEPDESSEAGSTEERMPTAAGAAPAGTVSTSTVPYLADVYVDGNRVGYSPAKVTVAPGKHVVRFEKPGYKSWSKEVVVEPNADVALDATLSKK
jgi:PEGA domain